MSSKKNNRWRSCPGCKTAAVDHSFGLLNKYCSGPDAEDNMAGAVDAAGSCGAPSQAQPTHSTAELLHAVRSLSDQIGAIQLEQTALKDQLKRIGRGAADTPAHGTDQTNSTPPPHPRSCPAIR